MCRLGLSLLAFEPPVPMWTTASAMSVLLWMAHTTMEVSERSIKDSLTTFNHENENNHADLFCKKTYVHLYKMPTPLSQAKLRSDSVYCLPRSNGTKICLLALKYIVCEQHITITSLLAV